MPSPSRFPGATPIQTLHKEYLRRNLVQAGATGVKAGIADAAKRLRGMRRPPKWLLARLEGMLPRAEASASELAKWRDVAPDAPAPVRGDGQ